MPKCVVFYISDRFFPFVLYMHLFSIPTYVIPPTKKKKNKTKWNSVKNWYLQKSGAFSISFFQMQWVLPVLKNRFKKI